MDARVARTVEVMHERCESHLSIAALAASVNLSPARLRELFNTHIGVSPMRYLHDLRMQKAEAMLRTTFLSIKQIALSSGAEHVSSFVHAFKKEHGMTPGEFRERYRGVVRKSHDKGGGSE
jgi:transcriptional regulator GlxA family with amidase domain